MSEQYDWLIRIGVEHDGEITEHVLTRKGVTVRAVLEELQLATLAHFALRRLEITRTDGLLDNLTQAEIDAIADETGVYL